jgi:hypothetical protein
MPTGKRTLFEELEAVAREWGAVGERVSSAAAGVLILQALGLVQRWIPVGERLPTEEPHGYVLICRNGVVGTANFFPASGRPSELPQWFVHDRDDETTPPDYWMPLPEPPA